VKVSAVIARARIPLNDADGTRYTDPDLLTYTQEAVRIIRRLRPDAFVGRLHEDPADGLGLDSDLPVSFEHYQTVADYVSARAQDRDDDLAGEKAGAWLQLAIGGLTQ
jgi:hypothetical protein